MPEIQTTWIVLCLCCSLSALSVELEKERAFKKKNRNKNGMFWLQANLSWRLLLFFSCLYCSCCTFIVQEGLISMAFEEVWRSEGLFLEIRSSPLSHCYRRDTENPLFRALAWDSGDQSSVLTLLQTSWVALGKSFCWLFKADFNRRISLKLQECLSCSSPNAFSFLWLQKL